MDDLTKLHLRDFGRQPVVKSAPMSATKAVRSSAPPPSWNRSSSERIAGDSLFGSNDDIFGGFPMSSNPSYGRSVSSSTFDSLFFDGFKEPSRGFHGDDIFATMSSPPELKPSTEYDDLFTTIPIIPPPPRSNYADGDLLGNFGQKLPSKQKGLDDKKPVKVKVKVKDQGLYGFDDVFLTTTLPPNNGYADFLDNLGRTAPEKDLSGSDELIPGFGGSIHTAPVKTEQPVPGNAMADSWENQQGDPWFSVVAKVPKSTRTPTPSRQPPLVAFATDPFSSATARGRGRAAADAEERTRQRVADALEKKMERDMEAHREQEERRGMARELDFVVKRWAAGKEGNLRALLSTLDDVLWPGCGWEPASLTDLITSTSVKKLYKKAALCVHPDKVQQKGATLQQKCIAEKVFDVLKEAWNKFNSEELQRSL